VALGDPAAGRLRGVRVEVLDLPGTTLGLASGAVVFLDADGAGHGWFLDPTPADDAEFVLAPAGGPAAGRIDLLTVIAHELGHVLGLDDDPETDPFTGIVMAAALAPGVRRVHLDGLLPGAGPVQTGTAARGRDPWVGGGDPAGQRLAPPHPPPGPSSARPGAGPTPGPVGAFVSPIGPAAPPEPVGSVGLAFSAVRVTAPSVHPHWAAGPAGPGAVSARRDAVETGAAAGESAAGGSPPAARLDEELATPAGPFVGIGGDPLVDWEHPDDFV
jgi:hypothetical protein